MLHSLEISCLPKDLPENIEADVSALDIGDSINIGDVAFPEGVVPTLGEDVVVALVAKARTAESEEDEAKSEAEAAEGAEGAKVPKVMKQALRPRPQSNTSFQNHLISSELQGSGLFSFLRFGVWYFRMEH